MKNHFNLLCYKELLQLEKSSKDSLFDKIFFELLNYQSKIKDPRIEKKFIFCY